MDLTGKNRIRTKVYNYLLKNCVWQRKTFFGEEFLQFYTGMDIPLLPPLLTKQEFTDSMIRGVIRAKNSFADINRVEVNTDGIPELVDSIYGDYEALISELEDQKRDFEARKKDFVPDYKRLLERYVKVVFAI